MKTVDGIKIWGDPIDEGALSQIKTCAQTAYSCALMADHHKGYAVPIGGVVAYEDQISPSGVGYDIACGNKAVLTTADAKDVRANIKSIMDKVWTNLSFGIGRKNETKVDHELFDDPAWKLGAVAPLKELARSQLGTIGSGNHYVDIFVDEQDRVWVGCHFGSRGLGHKTATYFLKAGGAKDGMDVEPLVLNVNSNLGADYIACMNLAGRYAYAGRDWVCDEVARLLNTTVVEEVHNHHNFAWKECHPDPVTKAPKDLWVVRKGATPSGPGVKGFVGGSMGDMSVILEGVESDENRQGLYSTVHGAGRVMGRLEAAGKFKWQTVDGKKVFVEVRAGKVTKQMMLDWIQPLGVELRGAGMDESPHCYKRLPEVLEHHNKSVRVLHRLTPLGVAMAGSDEVDPYKD